MAAIAFRGLTPFLKTMDLARTIDFYVNLLGFVVDMQWPAGTPTDWYPALGLSGQLWIDVDNVDALHATLVGKVPIEWGPEVYGYRRREFAIQDCNGYLLTFSARA